LELDSALSIVNLMSCLKELHEVAKKGEKKKSPNRIEVNDRI